MTIRYTIGTGCSGGSLTQQQVANAYPGIYQGILPQCSFPDAWSTGQQLADYHLSVSTSRTRLRWDVGVAWDPLSIAAIEGHPVHVNSIILDELYFTSLGDPTNSCGGVPEEQRYHPQTNKKGVRCTLADYMVNVLGRRPRRRIRRTSARRRRCPVRPGGVEEGSDHDGAVRGSERQDRWDDDRCGIPARARRGGRGGDRTTSTAAAAINQGNHLDQVAIIDLRGTDPGAFHDVYRAFTTRARIEREYGDYDNHVIWLGAIPILGDLTYTTQGLIAMDAWLASVEADKRSVPLAQKIRQDRPDHVRDQCSDGIGHVIVSGDVCRLINPIFTTPRMVAGEPITTDQNKCRLKPHRRGDYFPIVFTNDEWNKLNSAFPTGVCDWSRPGYGQQDTIAWQTYNDKVGGRPLGPRPRSTVLTP